MKFVVLLITFLFSCAPASAADLNALKKIFTQNYNTIYEPRFCGRNIDRFVSLVAEKNIDLSNSYVLKIEGTGFFETAAFYARTAPGKMSPLGSFHVVFIADHHVFDFDMHQPLVLPVEQYLRLQFSPPKLPFVIYGVNYDPVAQLSNWQTTRYEWDSYISNNNLITWKKPLGQWVNLKEAMK